MRFLLLGLLIGIILGILPLGKPVAGFEIYPEWHGEIDAIDRIDISKNTHISKSSIPPIKAENRIFLLSGNGYKRHEVNTGDQLTAVSGNGQYYVQFEKVGTTIEFFGIRGDRFWKTGSREYPYISYNGKIILLMNGDHSRIRILDFNGNEVGTEAIHGRFCTTIAFSKHTDFACIGFLDGSFYAIDNRGTIIYSGVIANNPPIKGMAISSTGNYLAVHHGGNGHDSIRVIGIRDTESYTVHLKHNHVTKTAIHVTSDGTLTVIDNNRILIFDGDGDIRNSLAIPAKRPGHSTIAYTNGLYVASYTKKTGEALFVTFRNDGVLYSVEFPEEPFLDCSINGSLIFLRGSRNLYCYSYSH